jgi:hypothetical protein
VFIQFIAWFTADENKEIGLNQRFGKRLAKSLYTQ